MVEWPDEASSDPWEDSLWDDGGLGFGTVGVPMSTVAVEGEDIGKSLKRGCGLARVGKAP